MTPEEYKSIQKIMANLVDLAIETNANLNYTYDIQHKDEQYKITITIKAKKI